ncbi:cupin domain-containing protein [Desulfobacterales bacterium HSG16]|nr:cupin domain-containing protein [Desulfobacterales bacterium HSG16]
MEKVSIREKFRTFDKFWQSKIIGEFNHQSVKLAKLRGSFDWHLHQSEDELLLVLKGKLTIRTPEDSIELAEGELFVVSAGLKHQFITDDEVHALIIEPRSTSNTPMPDVKSEIKLDGKK